MSEWISVDDKHKPEVDEYILMFRSGRHEGYWIGFWDGSFFSEHQECIPIDATHWMPLPEPPK